MSTAPTPNHEIDAIVPPQAQAEPWLRLVLVMVMPVLLLLIGISLTR